KAFDHGVFDWLAHRQGEVHELGGSKVLVAQENDFVIKQGLAYILCLRRTQTGAQINAADLGTQGASYFLYFHYRYAPGMSRPENINRGRCSGLTSDHGAIGNSGATALDSHQLPKHRVFTA